MQSGVFRSLEDEELIEMLSAGLISLIVVDKHKADVWKEVFPKITVHEDVAVRTGASIAWAFREGSPKLAAAVNDFAARNRPGIMAGEASEDPEQGHDRRRSQR